MLEIPYSPRDSTSIQLLFTRIAKKYDRTNRIISFGLDSVWRRRFIRSLADRRRIADVCCGSGALIPLLGNRILAGLDFTRAMLSIAALKKPAPRLVEGDAQKIPFTSGTFDAAVIVYSIRNIPDVPLALKELYRVLSPGGLLGILDFGVPRNKILESLYLIYFKRVMPFLGSRVAGDPSSYHYFVNSVINFPKRETFLQWMREAGFQNCRYEEYTLGAAICYLAEKGKD